MLITTNNRQGYIFLRANDPQGYMSLSPSRHIAKKVHTFATAGNQTCGQRFQVNRHLQLHHDGFCDLVNVSLFFTHITEYCNEYLRL